MPLIIEDGTGVANANSYSTLAQARAYALIRGVVLSADDSILTAQIILATDYLESFALQYVGQPTSYTQSLSWPRKSVQFDPDNPYPSNAIPPQLISAQCQAVIEEFNGITLQPSVDRSQGGFVTESKVGPLDTKYSEKIGTTSEPFLPKVSALLSALLNPGVALKTVRV